MNTDLVCMVVALAGLALLAAVQIYRAWRARRNEQQLRMEQILRRGFPIARRKGWLPEDLQ